MVEQPSYEKKLRKQYCRYGCRNTILAYAIGGPLGILLLATLLYLANRGSRGDDSAWVMAYAAAILAPVLMLAAAAAIGVVVARRRNRPLDEAFGSIGLAGKQLFAIDALLARSDESFAALAITPARLMYRLRFLPLESVTGASVAGWLANLETIVEAIEHIGPSEEGAELSDLEKRGQELNRRPWWGIALGCA